MIFFNKNNKKLLLTIGGVNTSCGAPDQPLQILDLIEKSNTLGNLMIQKQLYFPDYMQEDRESKTQRDT